jgi:S-adenosylmethionine synthetase
LKPLGYTENEIKILSHINQQSPNISKMVNRSRIALGAGDQGIVFGYATNKTATMMPLSMVLANELVVLATKLIKQEKFPGAKYDMKSQVTVD